MTCLSDDLKRMGYLPIGEESPVSDDGELWSNGHEIICGDTGVVIDGNHNPIEERAKENGVELRNGEQVFRYKNSEKVKLSGGFIGAYEWGDDNRPYNVTS